MLNSNKFQIGQVLNVDVYDENGVLLLPAGAVVTEQLNRRIRFSAKYTTPRCLGTKQPIRLADKNTSIKKTPQSLHTRASIQLDHLLVETGVPAPPAKRDVADQQLQLQHLRELVQASRDHFKVGVDRYAAIANDLTKDRALHVGPTSVMLNQLLASLRADPSVAMLVMDLQSSSDEYLFTHGMNVSMLTMRVAIQMGYRQEMVFQAGMAALFADIGMLTVPDSIRMAKRSLTSQELLEVQHHPIYTVDRLERAQSLTPTGLLIAFQTHERSDKSGYPRRRGEQFTHPLARVICAADTFCAVVCDHPYRPGQSPYQGITTLLREAKVGRLDKQIVRLLLECTSLFPVGSYVHLSNGCNAKVLRADQAIPQKPVVVPLNSDGSETDEELPLAVHGAPRITASLTSLEIAATA